MPEPSENAAAYSDAENRHDEIQAAISEGPEKFLEIEEKVSALQEEEGKAREEDREKEAGWFEKTWRWFREQVNEAREKYNRLNEDTDHLDTFIRSGGQGTSPHEVYYATRRWVSESKLTKEQIAERLHEVSQRPGDARSKAPVIRALFDMYQGRPPEYPPKKPKQDLADGSPRVDAKLLDFYVRCRRYALGLGKEQLLAQVEVAVAALEVQAPRFGDLLRFKAYVGSLVARHHDPMGDGSESKPDSRPPAGT